MADAFVALLAVHAHFPQSGSLKGKRKELKSLKERLRRKYGVSVAEVAHHDLWQRTELAVALVAESEVGCRRKVAAVERWLAEQVEHLRVDQRLFSAEDLLEL
jgi:uncharacterized protein